jgi:hypothetical protein
VNSYIRFGWTKPHTFCIAEGHWEQASLSARSLTPVAFATTLISHESFDIGSVTRQAPTQKDLVSGDGTVRTNPSEGASRAHDVKPPAT